MESDTQPLGANHLDVHLDCDVDTPHKADVVRSA